MHMHTRTCTNKKHTQVGNLRDLPACHHAALLTLWSLKWCPRLTYTNTYTNTHRWATYETCLRATMQHCLHFGQSNDARDPCLASSISSAAAAAASQTHKALEVVCLGSGLISPDQLMPPLLATACARSLNAKDSAVDIKVGAPSACAWVCAVWCDIHVWVVRCVQYADNHVCSMVIFMCAVWCCICLQYGDIHVWVVRCAVW